MLDTLLHISEQSNKTWQMCLVVAVGVDISASVVWKEHTWHMRADARLLSAIGRSAAR